MKITDVRIWLVKGTSALKAKADLTLVTDIGEMSLKGFRIVQSPGKGAFVGPPQEKYRDKNGKDVYKDLIWMNQSQQNVLYPMILDAFKLEVSESAPTSS